MESPLKKWFAGGAFIASAALASPAFAYVGPGAGGGGTTSNIGVGGWIVIVVAGGLGLCVLCGLIALAIAASDRLKSWVASRRRVDSTHGRAIDRPDF